MSKVLMCPTLHVIDLFNKSAEVKRYFTSRSCDNHGKVRESDITLGSIYCVKTSVVLFTVGATFE